MSKKNVIKNTTMLYLMNIAKIIFPLLTLPYLTRFLSVECYGVVSYVKTIMLYMQIIVDFGFMLSSTKEVVKERENNNNLEKIVSYTIGAKILLSIFAFVVLIIMIIRIELLRTNMLYTFLSFFNVFLSIFLFDFLFQGLEKMEIITLRYIGMKGISTFLTFVFVHTDKDVLWIPILDIIGSIVAVVLVLVEMRKLNIKFSICIGKKTGSLLKESAVYFASDMATSAFGALNTLLIGIYVNAVEVAYWNVAMQIVLAIQTLYNPITNGIYPEMIKNKDLRLIKRIFTIFMPIVVLGCIFTYYVSPFAVRIIAGEKYIAAIYVLRALLPVLLFSFPAMVLGWPTLGAIDKVKETTITTISTAILQIIGMYSLIIFGRFGLLEIALLRGVTEFFMLIFRAGYCWKNRKLFLY